MLAEVAGVTFATVAMALAMAAAVTGEAAFITISQHIDEELRHIHHLLSFRIDDPFAQKSHDYRIGDISTLVEAFREGFAGETALSIFNEEII